LAAPSSNPAYEQLSKSEPKDNDDPDEKACSAEDNHVLVGQDRRNRSIQKRVRARLQ
jgi:hypothetical protein